MQSSMMAITRLRLPFNKQKPRFSESWFLLFYSKSGAKGLQGVPPPPIELGVLLVTI